MTALTPNDVVQRFKRAKDRRSTWESHWQECYDYALPQRGDVIRALTPGAKRTDKLFDGTAPDAVDQLAASLLAQMTPPWTRWFGFRPGTDYGESDRDAASAALEAVAATLQRHLDRSNFVVEMHQCYLDLVTAGTACLLVEEAQVGEPSAFRFAAVPLSQVVLEEGPSGRLDTTYRRSEMTRAQIQARFKEAVLPADALPPPIGGEDEDERKAAVIEAVMPDKGGYAYMAVLETSAAAADEPVVLAKGRFASPPYINFRWLKAPGEIYGRSPVMKALPDIKTANKVVELVLKNATIAVTGIWQADDDGVLNPGTVKLTPGTIIPKAVGSAGLTPLAAPGKFDTSQVILDSLRDRIKVSLLVDKLGQVNGPKMTATEVLERSAEMARVLGATYGRLQAELLTPLLTRLLAILSRRGEIRPVVLDGRMADLDYRTPVGRYQTQNQAKSVIAWLDAVKGLGPAAMVVVDSGALARWMADAFGVPPHLLVPDTGGDIGAQGLDDLAKTAMRVLGAGAPVPQTVEQSAAAPLSAPSPLGGEVGHDIG